MADSWPEKVAFELRNERCEEFSQEENYRKAFQVGGTTASGPLETGNQAEGPALTQRILEIN